MKKEKPQSLRLPPTLPTRFLSWCLPNVLKVPVLGDLAEEFNQKSSEHKGQAQANHWYYRQCLRSGLQFLWFHRRGLLMFIFSFIAFVLLTLWAMWLGGEISMFWNFPSLLLVIPPAVLFAVGATSTNALKVALSLMLDDDEIPTSNQAKITTRLFSVMGNSALLLGALMTVLGWISMASNIESEAFANVFGPAFAVSMLTTMYAIGFKIICYVAEQKIQYKFDKKSALDF
jgi:hypothetical protein